MAYPTRSITGLPPNLFSGGAVGINTTPIVDYINNVQAKNNAKVDAFTKYFGALGKNLTPSGMHADDIDDVMKAKNAWQDHYLQNRKALLNPSSDDGAASMENNRLYNNAMDIARKSQAKVANLMSIKPIVDDPKRLALLSDESANAVHKAGLKVTDPQYQALNPNDLHFNPKSFDLGDQQKVSTVLRPIKPEQIPGTPVVDAKNGTQTTNYTPQYSKDQLQSMYQHGSDLYASHPGFKADIDRHADYSDPDYTKYNDLFHQHFKQSDGFNPDIQTPQDMAAIKTLLLNPNSVAQNPKVQPIPPQSALAQQNKRDFAKYTSGLSLGKQEALADHNFNNKLYQAQTKGDVSGFADDRINEALQKPSQPIIHPDGSKTEMHPMEASGAILQLFPRKSLTADNKKVTTYPNSLRVSPDGKTIYPVYLTSGTQESGNAGVNAEITKGFSKDEFKAVLQKAKIGVSPATTTTTRESSRSSKLTKGAFDHL